jgi:hypothetical protein
MSGSFLLAPSWRALVLLIMWYKVIIILIFVVASCRLSGGDEESRESVTSTRAHTLTLKKKKKKKKKEFAPVIRVDVVTRRVSHMVSEPVRPATWGSRRLSLTCIGFIILLRIELNCVRAR